VSNFFCWEDPPSPHPVWGTAAAAQIRDII